MYFDSTIAMFLGIKTLAVVSGYKFAEYTERTTVLNIHYT
jgi:hypothetical protein